MKILHTADWHIGKKLHKTTLSPDFDLFIDWLCKMLTREQVDLLLVSGDIFDLANPSSEARAQYYRALIQLKKCDCSIILTGGNHDSPAMLDAPKEVLKELDVHILGGLPENLSEAIIPIPGADGEPALVIAALPFLRDGDLRSSADGITYEDRLESTRRGIQRIFSQAANLCAECYPGIPALAMGHLFAAGMEGSESERDIQIGNQAAVDAAQFGNYFRYIALGHIHKPQRVSAAIPVFYSGSPLPLSFSERKDEKRVLLLDTKTGWDPESIPVPAIRSLVKVSGSLEELRVKLENLPPRRDLESLVEVSLQEAQYDAMKLYQLDELVSQFTKPGYSIVKHRAIFDNHLKGASESYEAGIQLEDLQPKEVFLELLDGHEYDTATTQEIISAFDEILQEVKSEESNRTA